jgi:hypothetical protein
MIVAVAPLIACPCAELVNGPLTRYRRPFVLRLTQPVIPGGMNLVSLLLASWLILHGVQFPCQDKGPPPAIEVPTFPVPTGHPRPRRDDASKPWGHYLRLAKGYFQSRLIWPGESREEVYKIMGGKQPEGSYGGLGGCADCYNSLGLCVHYPLPKDARDEMKVDFVTWRFRWSTP